MRASRAAIAVWVGMGFVGEAGAVPGPASVAVVANSTVAESVELARRYLRARSIPERQLCLLDLPTADTIPLDSYRTALADPLDACLDAAGVSDRIEAVVLVRGVPLRVTVPVEGGDQRASLAATLSAWKSTVDGEPLVGRPPGVRSNCGGTPCLAAQWRNPFAQGVFEAGWTRSTGGVEWRPLIVTMLNARSTDDAARLVSSATTAEAFRPSGQFLFMRGANPPRAVLDSTSQSASAALAGLALDAEVVDFQTNLSGRNLAAFFTGTQTLGDAIEGNTYLPGSIVDNLTSLGAVPRNFQPAPEGGEPPETQVSVSRWVEQGVAGVHGCTDEPLNNTFPSRMMAVDYAEGGTLGEAYHRHLPFAYWRNLVLGDPMAAPYAVRPRVEVDGLEEGSVVVGSQAVDVRAIDDFGRGVARLVLYVDGLEVAAADDRLSACVEPPVGRTVQVLAVAQVADDGGRFGRHRPKGWISFQVEGRSGPAGCPAAQDMGGATDQGARDLGAADMGPSDGGGSDAGFADMGDPGSTDQGPIDRGSGGEPGPGLNDAGGCRHLHPESAMLWLLALAGGATLGHRTTRYRRLFGSAGRRT